MSETTQFLSTQEAAAYLTLKPSTLEAWRSRGGGPRFCKFGGAVRYRVADLDAYAEARSRNNTIRGNVIRIESSPQT